MMICPVIVGTATSIYDVTEAQLGIFRRVIERSTRFFFLFMVVDTGVITGSLPTITGLAPQVMTSCLLASLFIAIYVVEKNRTALAYWAGLAAVPIIGLTRTGIAATMITYPASLAPVKMVRRIVALALISLLTIAVFYTERVQNKMFYSGTGSIFEMSMENPDFRTTGRSYLWKAMNEQIAQSPWLGFGANANEQFILRYTGILGQPHNDFLRIRFDYGYVGLYAFLFCCFIQSLHAWNRARGSAPEVKSLFYAGASAFIPFLVFMYTDNIILYCQFFGNLQFTILGLAYTASRKRELQKSEDQLTPSARMRQAFHLARIGPRGSFR